MKNSAKRTIGLLVASVLLWTAYVTPATSAVPFRINYQGYLTSSSGTPINATVTMTFKIYNDSSGGIPLYSETQSVSVANGLYNVALGTVSSLIPALSFDIPYYLGVTVGADAEMTPRQMVNSVPYALKADDAMTLAGISPNRVVTSNANGNVDIGRGLIPQTRLGLGLGPSWTSEQWSGSLALPNASTIAWEPNASGQRFGMGVSTGGLYVFRTTSPFAATVNPPIYAMTITDAGNVGFGPTIPLARLSLGLGPVWTTEQWSSSLALPNASSIGWDSNASGQRFGIGVSTGGLYFFRTDSAFNATVSPPNYVMAISDTGNVGIGQVSPTKAKLEISSTSSYFTGVPAGFIYGQGGASSSPPSSFTNNSIYATNRILASEYYAFSDERIKHIDGRSDPARDLATLAGIEVADFTYIDTSVHGPGKQKKLIAQQVETVYPQAVRRTTDVVPDIFRKAEVRNGWISLATNLKKGERVRLIGLKKEGVHEVLDVAPGRFRTDFAADGNEVFVYGREVKDFRNVDYEAIAMLNVSATQELSRRLEKQANDLAAQAAEIAALKQQLIRMARISDEHAPVAHAAVGPGEARESGRVAAIR